MLSPEFPHLVRENRARDNYHRAQGQRGAKPLRQKYYMCFFFLLRSELFGRATSALLIPNPPAPAIPPLFFLALHGLSTILFNSSKSSSCSSCASIVAAASKPSNLAMFELSTRRSMIVEGGGGDTTRGGGYKKLEHSQMGSATKARKAKASTVETQL